MNSTSVSPIFSTTSTGIWLTTATATLSAVSSALILNVICKSPQKLNTTYHRMMALMSIFDIFASVCMALTTLPMPSDDVIRFDGPMLGNEATCNVQGYIIIMGLVGSNILYMFLSWYFVCMITFKISSHVIARRIEPFFHVITAVFSISIPSYYLSNQMINSTPRDQFCTIGFSHAHCNYTIEQEFYECESSESNPKYSDFYDAVFVAGYIIISIFTMIVVAMIIIIHSIWRNSRRISQSRKTGDDNQEAQSHIMELQHSRVLITQALLYIIAYFMTWSFMILPNPASFSHDQLNVLQVFKAILFPMQGFWNLMIFLFDKAYLLLLQQEGDDGFRGFLSRLKVVLIHPDHASGIFIDPFVMNHDHELNYSEPEEEQDTRRSEDLVYKSQINPEYDNLSALRESSVNSSPIDDISIDDSLAHRTGFISNISPNENWKSSASFVLQNTRKPWKRNNSESNP